MMKKGRAKAAASRQTKELRSLEAHANLSFKDLLLMPQAKAANLTPARQRPLRRPASKT